MNKIESEIESEIKSVKSGVQKVEDKVEEVLKVNKRPKDDVSDEEVPSGDQKEEEFVVLPNVERFAQFVQLDAENNFVNLWANFVRIPNFKGKVWNSDSPGYEKHKRQHATSSYPAEKMTPGLIVEPTDDDDIRAILAFAQSANPQWNVIARSGGHQYSGLSSGDASTIQVDMKKFRKDPIEHVEDSDIVKVGPCNYLGEFAKYLHHQGLALPFGDEMGVNLGGHVQTGGYGNSIRGLGLFLDHVESFDIIRADGTKMHVTRPTGVDVSVEDEKWDVSDLNDNDAMFWAVMGGNPCSFGIITEIELRCIRDADRPFSTGVKVYYIFSRKVLEPLMEAFTKIQQKAYAGEIPADYDFFFTIGDVGRTIMFICFQGIYSNLSGEDDYDPKWFKMITDAAKHHGIDIHTQPIKDTEHHTISYMMTKAVLLHHDREFNDPYKRACRGTPKPWDPKFVKAYCDAVDRVRESDCFGLHLKMVSQMQLLGGAYYTNDPYAKVTSISRRNQFVGVTFDLFYNDFWNKEKKWESIAVELLERIDVEWVKEGLFNVDKEDLRVTWATFGDTNIENERADGKGKVWSYYYDDEKRYTDLRKVKTRFDKGNVFHNEFTIPPLDFGIPGTFPNQTLSASMSTTTFAAYNQQYSGYKRGKQKYYELGIETYIKTRDRDVTAEEAWPYFNNGDIPWSKRYFADRYYNIRRRLATEDTTVQLEATVQSKRDELTDVDCHAAINAIKKVLDVLTSKKDAVSLQTKQTILSALCILNEDGTVENRHVLEHLNPTMNVRLFRNVVSLRKAFDASESLVLYDKHAANKGGTRKQFSNEVDQSIIDFWIANTTEDPNTYKFRKLKDENGEKYKQCYHYCHIKYKDMYSRWIEYVVGQYKWKEEKLPKFWYFMNLKPVYVYKVQSGDYSACKKCYNFEQMTKALLRKLSARGAHSIRSTSCPNYNWHRMGDECDCDHCFQCDATLQALKSSPLRLLKYLFCKTDDRYPPMNCVEGNCNQCGIFKIVDMLHSPKINIKDSETITFREIVKVTVPLLVPKKDKKDKKVHANVRQEYLWSDFRKLYIDSLRDHCVHYNRYIQQHQTRRDFIDFTIGRIPHDAIVCHIDFIHKIPVQYSKMSNGMWADGEKVAFMISYDRFQDGYSPGGLTEESTSYFCDDKDHGWSATLTYVRKHIAFRLKYFKEHYDKDLKHFIFWSDNGEAGCGAFLAKVSEIAEEFNVYITWNFTAAGHSKGKHDGEGHTMKTEIRSAIDADAIMFDKTKEPYSVTIKKHLEKFYADPKNKSKFKRHFFSIPTSEIEHFKAPSVLVKRLTGILDYHCFIMADSRRIMYRKHSCVCGQCISGIGYTKCRRSSIVGEWTAWRPERVSSSSTSANKSSTTSSNISSVSFSRHLSVPPPLLDESKAVGGGDMLQNSSNNQDPMAGNSAYSNQYNAQQHGAMYNAHSGQMMTSQYRFNPLHSMNNRR